MLISASGRNHEHNYKDQAWRLNMAWLNFEAMKEAARVETSSCTVCTVPGHSFQQLRGCLHNLLSACYQDDPGRVPNREYTRTSLYAPQVLLV